MWSGACKEGKKLINGDSGDTTWEVRDGGNWMRRTESTGKPLVFFYTEELLQGIDSQEVIG